MRNICAHHGRLWNKGFAIKPKIPRKMAQWHNPATISNNRMFGGLSIVNYLLTAKGLASGFKEGFLGLLIQYKEIPKKGMGIIDNWEKHEIWL